jgi:phosphoribosyl-AMP cyclohydrolase
MPDTNTPRFAPRGDKESIEAGLAFQPKFDADGLIPAIVTDAGTGEVLMFAWMNAEALALTLKSGVGHFWSRSRRALWKKGEESGNILRVVELRTDCDQDVLWLRAAVEGDGLACHTGRRSCFYRSLPIGSAVSDALRLKLSEDPPKG